MGKTIKFSYEKNSFNTTKNKSIDKKRLRKRQRNSLNVYSNSEIEEYDNPVTNKIELTQRKYGFCEHTAKSGRKIFNEHNHYREHCYKHNGRLSWANMKYHFNKTGEDLTRSCVIRTSDIYNEQLKITNTHDIKRIREKQFERRNEYGKIKLIHRLRVRKEDLLDKIVN